MLPRNHPLAKLLKLQMAQIYNRADVLLTVDQNNMWIDVYDNGTFVDSDEVTILERLLSRRVKDLAERFLHRPYQRINPRRYFGLCAHYSIDNPEIDPEMCLLVATKLGSDFAEAVSKLDDVQWELEIMSTKTARELNLLRR